MPSVCPSSWPVGQVLTLIVLFIGGVSGGMPTGAVLLRWIWMGLFRKHIRLNLSRRIHGTGILGGGFKYFLFSTLFGDDSHFD